MIIRRPITIPFILILLLYAPFAYSKNFFFSHLGVENGLSQVSVLDIFQDSDGYIWFGTRNGANRFDGYEFKIYQNEVNDTTTLSDNYIRCFAEDSHQNIWIGTSNGINCIDYQTQKLTRFYPQSIHPEYPTNTINQLFRHTDGNVYAAIGNRILQCNKDQTTSPIRLETEIGSQILSIAQNRQGTIYLGTQNSGLYIFTHDWKLKQHFSAQHSPEYHLPTDEITVLLPDNNGNLWMGFENSGICFFDGEKKTFSCLNTENSGLSNNTVRVMTHYNADSILIGTFRGLNILNTQTRSIHPADIDISGQGGLSHFSIHSLLIDKDQTLWVGTYSAGINYHSPFHKSFFYLTSDKFAGIFGKGQEDRYGNMWFATEGSGLFKYNPQTGERHLYPIKPIREGNYEANIIKSILIKGDSIFCATHFGSVYLFSISSQQYKLLYDFKYNDIYSLYIDSRQRLWIPTNSDEGLVVIDGDRQIRTFTANGKQRSFSHITQIHEVEPDLFLLGALQDSLYLYDMKKQTVRNLASQLKSLSQSDKIGSITTILQDSKGFFWISTSKNGLYRLNTDFQLVKHYQKEDGLPGSQIQSLSIDNRQTIWATVGKSLYKWDRTTDTFDEVNINDIPPQEFTFYAGNNMASNGTLYFPSDKGILYFNPNKMVINPHIPPVYLTAVILNNEKEIMGNAQNHTLTLSAYQNNITFKYTALNFIHPEMNQYTYKLEGADLAWHSVGNRREANYSNLAPGSYTFRIKASNNDGVWNPEETTLHIVIKPPFYRTWWAYLTYIALFFFLTIRLIRYQQNKQEREREIRFKQMEQEKINEWHEERMRMFTNFSHELRTPLTLIINPLTDLMQHVSFSQEVKNTLLLIKKNTERMLLLVNNLMDIQKYEAGKSILKKSRFDFSTFIQEMYRSFESVAHNRNIAFSLNNRLPESYVVYLDEAEMEKVFFNLLSNAFKFTPSEGHVSMRACSIPQADCLQLPHFPIEYHNRLGENRYLFVEIIDDGTGIDAQETEKIFEPFYRSQTDIHQQISGTGIGLNLTRSIIRQHGGCIWTETSKETGTRFMFLLPDTEKQPLPVAETSATAQTTETIQMANRLVEETENKEKPTILLVDDNEEMLAYLEQQLYHDYNVKKAGNGKEALANIEKIHPDIVICDIMMPEMNGLELCRHLKGDSNYRHIPIVLLTAKSMVSQIEEGLEAGADDYIVKPFQISILKARVRNILNLRAQMKTIYSDTLSLQQFGINESDSNDDFLKQYIHIVKANLSNPDFDVPVIYETLGMSRTNFYRKVKAVTGLSPIDLIKNIRLEVAAKLLKESNLNISEIAQQVGFSSRSYFARSFKSVYGMSPTEYQESENPDRKSNSQNSST